MRHLLCLGLSALVLAASAPSARAQDAPVIAALDATMRDWMRQHGVPAAALAAIKDGRLAGSFNYSGMDPAKPARIASLSKAITAVCVARLIDDGRLSFSAPLATVLADAFRRFGQPADPRFKTITIEQLLMHRAGLAREAFGGPAQDMSGTFRRVLATPLETDPGRRMSYSNIGYLTLGVIAETVTGSSYEQHCGAAALAAMKVSGSIDPQLRARAPNGGWRVSAIDYARFVQVFDAEAGVLGEISRKWQDMLSGNPAYGLGTFLRRTAIGRTFWHSGRVPLRERGGAYSIKFDNGWTAVATFNGDVREGAGDLRRRLEAAVSNR